MRNGDFGGLVRSRVGVPTCSKTCRLPPSYQTNKFWAAWVHTTPTWPPSAYACEGLWGLILTHLGPKKLHACRGTVRDQIVGFEPSEVMHISAQLKLQSPSEIKPRFYLHRSPEITGD